MSLGFHTQPYTFLTDPAIPEAHPLMTVISMSHMLPSVASSRRRHRVQILTVHRKVLKGEAHPEALVWAAYMDAHAPRVPARRWSSWGASARDAGRPEPDF